MALLHCRECQAEINSDARQAKCKSCGTLFPFQCAVCERGLRPPFPVYPDERHLNERDEPLCEEHYQRLCPGCSKWFQADENPGFFLCRVCSQNRAKITYDSMEEDILEYGDDAMGPRHAVVTGSFIAIVCILGALAYFVCPTLFTAGP